MSECVLFFDVSGSHLPLILSVARRGFTPVVHSPLAPHLKPQGLQFHTFEDFVPADIQEEMRREVERITDGLQAALGTPEVRGAFSSSMGDFLPLTGDAFFRQLVGLAAHEIAVLGTLENLAGRLPLRLIVMGCDNSPTERIVVDYASRAGITTLQLAHAIYTRPIARIAAEHKLYSDYIAVYGRRAKDIMVDYGIEPERIFVTGAPAWDPFYAPGSRVGREEARSRLGLDPRLPTMLYCSAYVDGSSAFFPAFSRRLIDCHRAVAESHRYLEGRAQLMVRPHPNELARAGLPQPEVSLLDEAYLRWMNDNGLCRTYLSRANKIEALRAADIVVAIGSSSIIAEAMILERPVVLMPWLKEEDLIYREEDGVLPVYDGAELPELAADLLFDDARRAEMVRRQKEVLPELNHENDGRATERVAELVEKLSARASSSAKPSPKAAHQRSGKGGEPLNLLFAAHNFLPYGLGGTERYTRDLAREMIRRGHSVRVLYPRYVLDEPGRCSIREGRYRDLEVTELHTFKNAFGFVRNDALKPVVRQYLTENPVDLVHAQHIMGLTVSFLEVLEELQLPFVFTANDFWFLCQEIHMVEPIGTVCQGPETIDKCVHCMNTRIGGVPEEQYPQLFQYVSDRFFTQRRAAKALELMLCPSSFLMDVFRRYGFSALQTVHAPQGANLFTPLERPLRQAAPVVFSYVGTVDYRKGTDLAVEAFNRIETRDAELRIHGNIANQAYHESIMRAVSPGKVVTYRGAFTAEDLPGILAETDVAIVPSRGENYPFVIREILNARVPVIASAIAGIPEIVKDGRNGLLFKGNDVADLASKMERFIKEPELIEVLRAGIEPVKSVEQDAEEIEGHYRSVLARRGRPSIEELVAEEGPEGGVKVSIVIPAFNRLELTKRCLETLHNNTLGGSSFEVIVVDNGSTDGTADFLIREQEAGRLRAVLNPQNLGFSRACNQGAQGASGRYVIFLNNDTEVQPGWLEPMVEVLEADPRVAAVGSKLLFPDGTIQHAGVVISERKGTDLLDPSHVFYKKASDHPPANVPHVYQAVTAACMMVRRSAFEAVGAFDEEYWNGFEDVDLCFRLQERGWLVVYEPRSVVVHLEGQSGPERISHSEQNLERLRQKWQGKVKPDVVIEPGGEQKSSGAGRARRYVTPLRHKKSASGKRTASIVVVTYNSASTIRSCLDTVLHSSSTEPEVIVVDNASSDETRSILAEYEGRVKTILNEENLGFSRGCNQGILASGGSEYVVLLNPDTAVTPGWIERMAAHFAPDVGAVGPVSNFVAALQQVHRYMPKDKEGSFGIVELADILYRHNRGSAVETKLLVGFCIMLSRKALGEVGLLDDDLFLGNDDLDMSWRLRQAGYRLLVATDTFVYHEGQVSFRSEEESKTSALVQESTDKLYAKLETHYGEGRVPHPMELWGIDWFKPSRAKFRFDAAEGERPLTSIVILTMNELEHTKLCLASIEANTPEPHEIIVVDNGSSDGTVEFLREYMASQDHVRVVANSSNRGFSAGNNLGIALAKGDFILLLNNDTMVTRGWLGRMLAVFDRYERAGIVGSVSNRVSGPQLVEEASYESLEEMEAFAERWAEEHSGWSEAILRVVGFCLLVKREVVERIGGLDESFGSGNFEDDDFCIRAAQAGYEARIARDAFVHHTGSQTFKGARIDYRESMLRNWDIFKAKWGIPASTPMEGVYHLPEKPPAGAGRYVELPGLEADHRAEEDGRWWQEVPGSLRRIKVGFIRHDGDKTAEAQEALVRFNGGFGPLGAWPDSASVNRGLSEADHLVLLAPDVLVTKSWLESLMSVAETEDAIAAVGPTSNSAPKTQRVKAAYSSLKKALHKFASRRWHQNKDAWEEVPYLGGFCLLLKSRAVADVGGLASGLPLAEALWELFARLKDGGYKLACAQGAYVHHEELTEDEGARYDEWAEVEQEVMETFSEGHAALERGDLESAADLFGLVSRRAPHLASAHWAMGSTLLALDDFERGIPALERAAELLPAEAPLHNQLGVALYERGLHERARETLQNALRSDPSDLDVLLNLVEICCGQDRLEEAAAYLGQARELAPADPGVLSAQGALSLEMGDNETALKALQRLREVEPGHPEIRPLEQALGGS